MSCLHYPTDNLLRGRRRLEEIEEIVILQDWIWDDTSNRFFMRISISIDEEHPDIPQKSEWYIVSEDVYPFGSVGVYPSATNSIVTTFPHMESNHVVEPNGLWRSGKLCVEMDFRALGRNAPIKEPHTVDDRLFWYARRAILWIKAAATSSLLQNGDYYEKPDFNVSFACTVAYAEDCVSLMQWEDTSHQFGIAKIRKRKDANHTVFFVDRFLSLDEKETICCPMWGTYVSDEGDGILEDALWVKLPDTLVTTNWQAPMTFETLKSACISQNIDIISIIKSFAPKARTGHPHFVLFGFPIPKRIGESPCEMLWQALLLPKLSYKTKNNERFQSGRKIKNGTYGAPPGFRPNEKGWWRNDLQSILTNDLPLTWINSQNWSSDSITSRGKLSDALVRSRVAVVGSGSLGSMLCELLIRAGVICLTCIDHDFLQVGNLCRHTLDLRDINKSKSEALASKLSTISPHAKVCYENRSLSVDIDGSVTPDLSRFDIIIDTTGNDAVLDVAAKGIARNNVVFFSTAVGLGAKRIYMYLTKGAHPTTSDFSRLCEPYFQLDREDCDIGELPRDGIGCWHPLFPARADDMWLAAATSIKVLEAFCMDAEHSTLTAILENKDVGGIFAGYQPVEIKYSDAQ